MSVFTDRMASDLDVFFNVDEFGELHNINGVDDVVCIPIEEDIKSLRPGLARFEGTYRNILLLMIKQSDWQWDEPAYNDLVSFDSVQYVLKSSALVGGQYEILLQAVK